MADRLQNVLLPIEILERKVRPSHRDHASSLLKLVGLSGFEDAYPHELSGGMQQRVSICRALVHNPSFLLMDEPFGALDAMTRDKMNLELLRIWEEAKKTLIFITHNIAEAVFLSDRVVVLTGRPGSCATLLPSTPRARATHAERRIQGDRSAYPRSDRRGRTGTTISEAAA